MCFSCVLEHLDDGNGGHAWPPLTSIMLEAADLARDLYTRYCTGGPLHVLIDDYNLDDGCVLSDWNLENIASFHYGEYTERFGVPLSYEQQDEDRRSFARLLKLLQEMNEAERNVAIAICDNAIDLKNYPYQAGHFAD